jgi:hypothetical protein
MSDEAPARSKKSSKKQRKRKAPDVVEEEAEQAQPTTAAFEDPVCELLVVALHGLTTRLHRRWRPCSRLTRQWCWSRLNSCRLFLELDV